VGRGGGKGMHRFGEEGTRVSHKHHWLLLEGNEGRENGKGTEGREQREGNTHIGNI
jgi:hypothetical protein